MNLCEVYKKNKYTLFLIYKTYEKKSIRRGCLVELNRIKIYKVDIIYCDINNRTKKPFHFNG